MKDKTSDIIREAVQSMFNIPATDPDRETKAVALARGMMEKVARHRAEVKQSRVRRRPPQSLSKATGYYNNPERVRWIARITERYESDGQLAVTDAISPWYTMTMGFMTILQAGVMFHVLESYHRGISATDIAGRYMKPVNIITTTLSRLKNAGFVASRKDPKDKRRSLCYAPDKNWIRAYAIKDYAFWNWLEEDKGPKENLVDRFIIWRMENKPCRRETVV